MGFVVRSSSSSMVEIVCDNDDGCGVAVFEKDSASNISSMCEKKKEEHFSLDTV